MQHDVADGHPFSPTLTEDLDRFKGARSVIVSRNLYLHNPPGFLWSRSLYTITDLAPLNGSQMDGRTLTVNEAKPQEPRSGGGGGRFSGGGRGKDFGNRSRF